MKILHVVFSFNIGGAETMLVELLNEQCKKEEVNLVVVNNLFDIALIKKIDKKVAVYFVNRFPGTLNVLKLLYFNHLLFKVNPDVIHFHEHNAVKLVIASRNAKKYLTIHDVNVPTHNFAKYDKLFAISRAVMDDILERANCKSQVIYNGINFQPVIRRMAYDTPGVFKIVQVSRLNHLHKGQHILLKAIHKLVFDYGITNLQCDLIGEGKSLNYLVSLTNELDLSPYVKFLGIKDRDFIYSNLKDYNLLIQPSIYEGFGLTVVEGVAAGLPVIVSNIDGPTEIIDGLPGCRNFESQDYISLATCILEIIRCYKDNQIKQLCAVDYLLANKKFSIQLTSDRYLAAYM